MVGTIYLGKFTQNKQHFVCRVSRRECAYLLLNSGSDSPEEPDTSLFSGRVTHDLGLTA